MTNISVFVRIRPMLQTEVDSFQEPERRYNIAQDKKQISVQVSNKREKVFNFNKVFGPETNQQMLCESLQLHTMSQKVLDGYHSTIFAYGQTGSGKTYTIEGPNDDPGLISRTFEQLFGLISQRNNVQRSYKVLISFVQIYNQGIYDLIDCTGKPLKMRWNKHQQFLVENLFEAQCRSKEDAFKWWKKGQRNKIMGSHKMNTVSSRSHCLLTLKISSYNIEDPSDTIQSKFQIVDLAGSQRQKITKSTGVVFKEGIEINKSLFALRQVISSLYQISQGENTNKHIPYRDSKLTSLLKQSIGGNTFCSMIACLNPTSTHFQESLQTLTYASMASFISNVPMKNIDPKIKENEQLREQNEQYRKQIKKMSEHIENLTKLLEAGACVKCQNSQNQSLKSRNQSNKNWRKSKDSPKYQQANSQPTGIVKFPKFQKAAQDDKQSASNLNKNQIKVPKTQKKTLKTTKDVLESITMIKQLISANSSLREKMEALRQLHQKQDKQIFGLMQENQVLRNRWDMMNDAIQIQGELDTEEAPIAAYEKLIQGQSNTIVRGDSFSKNPRMSSQNSQGTKSTAYNYFLKNNYKKKENSQISRRKNQSLRQNSNRFSHNSGSFMMM